MSEYGKKLDQWYEAATKDEVARVYSDYMTKHFAILRQQRDAYRNLAIIFHQDFDSDIGRPPNLERSTKFVDDLVTKLCKVAHDDASIKALPPATPLTVLDDISSECRFTQSDLYDLNMEHGLSFEELFGD
jgi:hypothetical protein